MDAPVINDLTCLWKRCHDQDADLCTQHTFTLEVRDSSFEKLLFDTVPDGKEYEDAIIANTKIIIENTRARLDLTRKRIALIDIPRGGIPTGTAVEETLRADPTNNVSRFHSYTKINKPAPMPRQIDYSKTDSVVIADGVIATGGSIVEHIDNIPQGWSGNVTVLSNAAAEIGLKRIFEAFTNRDFASTALVTGHVFKEHECDWVECDGGKSVYFVGYNKERNFDCQLPDFGDKITPAVK